MAPPETAMTARVAVVSDCEQVFRLARQMATSFEVDFLLFDQIFDDLLATNDSRVIVAESGDRLLGYVLGFDHPTFFANGRVSWVEEIFVDPSARRQGIAAMLMSAFEAWCVDRESKLVALATRRASGFYSAIGYEESASYFRKMLS